MATKCEYDDLALDEACLLLGGKADEGVAKGTSLYALSSDCVSCPFSRIASIGEGSRNESLRFNTARSVIWRVYNDSGSSEHRSSTDERGIICQLRPDLGEYGIYELSIGEEGDCQFRTILEPRDRYAGLAIALGIVLASVVCLLLALCLGRWCIDRKRSRAEAEGTGTNSGNECDRRPRILAVDTFRGISILAMIFVNNGAGGYAILEHATWDGLAVGDLVFPCFVWVMGVCVPLSLSSQLARGIPRLVIVRGILRRSVLLFIIDLSLNTASTSSAADLKTMRIFGVLQRFAVAYAFVAVTYALPGETRPRGNSNSPRQREDGKCTVECASSMTDSSFSLLQWILVSGVTALHCFLTFRLPVPGCPTGYLGPGGRHADGQFWNCTGGAAGYIDRIVLGEEHLYQRPSISDVYGSGPFDPEGILGCATTILQTFLGVQAGKILGKVNAGWKDRVSRWLVIALACACIGSVLHCVDIIPVNKSLWSLSFVLLTTSFALTLFTACYLLVDVTRIWRGGPFRIPGSNALVMYIGHRLCYRMFPFHWQYGRVPVSHEWRTIAAVWDVAAWTIVAYWLHRKRIYVRL